MSTMSVWDESGKDGGTGFLYRDPEVDPFDEYYSWTFRSWKTIAPSLRPHARGEAIALINTWKKTIGKQYALLQCSGCHAFHPTSGQTGWTGDRCSACSGEEIVMPKPFLLPKKKDAPKMNNGEVRKLPIANSPMWTTQWAAQGSAKLPYIISQRPVSQSNGATTSEGWACSCRDFTSHTPRADCKHICWVKKFEKIPLSAAPVAMLPKEQQEAFQKFLLEQAKAGTPAIKVDKKPFITQGRRFR